MPPVSRDAVKRMKRMDLAVANEVLTGEGEQVDKAAPKRWRVEAAAEKAEGCRRDAAANVAQLGREHF